MVEHLPCKDLLVRFDDCPSEQGVAGSNPARGFMEEKLLLTFGFFYAALSIALLLLGLTKKRNEMKFWIGWSFLFFVSFFLIVEYILWLEGTNLFLLTTKSFPLMFGFATIVCFYFWIFYSIRKTYGYLLLAFIAISLIIATFCMNCL